MQKAEPKRKKELDELQGKIGYAFKSIELLNNALTHSSYINNKNDFKLHNQRLEFMGDSILNMIVSLQLYTQCDFVPEGQLTRMRALIVCEQSLFAAAEKLALGRYLLMSKGEENTGGRTRVSSLADAYEALVAAIYLDGGLNKASTFVLETLKDVIDSSVQNKVLLDYKSYLQEHVQKHNSGKLHYKMLSEQGPDHSKTFEMAIYLDENIIGKGIGHSKKDAQQAAARCAIEGLGL